MERKIFLKFVFLLYCITSWIESKAQSNGYHPYPQEYNSSIRNLLVIDSNLYALIVSANLSKSNGKAKFCKTDSTNKNLFECLNLNDSVIYDDVLYEGDNTLFVGLLFSKNEDFPDTLVLEQRTNEFEYVTQLRIPVGQSTFFIHCVRDDSLRIFVTSFELKTDGIHEIILDKNLKLTNVIHKKHNTTVGGTIYYINKTLGPPGYIVCTASGVHQLDKQFNILKSTDSLINGNANMIIPAIDGGYVCFGRIAEKGYQALGITKMDINLKFLSNDTFAYKQTPYPAIYTPLAIDKKHYFVAGMLDVWNNDVIIGTEPNYFYIGKYDTEINRVWLKKKGGERHYALYGITADGNGGCCVYGFVREQTGIDNTIPFIMCFNDQGELTSYTTPQLPEERLFSIKGNPAYTSITLGNSCGQTGYTYCIFDTNGRQVAAGVLNTDDTVLDVSKLSAGMYLLSIQNKDAKVIQVEKLVKQ